MPPLNRELLAKAKSLGFSDRQIAHLTGQTEDAVRAERKRQGLVPSYRLVDTCGTGGDRSGNAMTALISGLLEDVGPELRRESLPIP